MICCSGCMACYKTGHCHIKKDGLEDLSQRIGDCDGFIIGKVYRNAMGLLFLPRMTTLHYLESWENISVFIISVFPL